MSSEQRRNGFRESGEHGGDGDDVTLRHVRLAHYILETKGDYVPTPDRLRELGEGKPPVETLASVTDKIRALKRQHAVDLETLFRFQRAEYHQELIDHRIGHDVSDYMHIDEAYPDQVEFRAALEALDGRVERMERFKRDADDALSTLRYTHLKTLTYLIARRNALGRQDKEAQRRRDAWFPQTVQQYHHIAERDVRLRVARLLTSPTTEQERLMDEFGWPYRAVQPLLSAYKSSAAFKGEVDGALRGLVVADPRRRPSSEAVFTRFSPVS